jgi:hypothetical protein
MSQKATYRPSGTADNSLHHIQYNPVQKIAASVCRRYIRDALLLLPEAI